MSVPDVQAAASRVEKDGGKVLMPPRTLGERGTVALFLDPEGGLFGVINSASGDPEDFLLDDNQWLWIELMASDPAKMADFYKGIGTYDVVGGAASGESSGFRLKSGGYARAGIQTKLDQKYPTTWVPYLRVKSVADTVASASAAGATIVMQPTLDARHDGGDHRGSDRSAGRAGRVARRQQGAEMNNLRRPLLVPRWRSALRRLPAASPATTAAAPAPATATTTGTIRATTIPAITRADAAGTMTPIVVNPPDRPGNGPEYRPDRQTHSARRPR